MKDELKREHEKEAAGLKRSISDIKSSPKYIPDSSVVEDGYVSPSDLEFSLRDTNFDGDKETILRIKGREYHLRDVSGNPALYEVKTDSSSVTDVYGREHFFDTSREYIPTLGSE